MLSTVSPSNGRCAQWENNFIEINVHSSVVSNAEILDSFNFIFFSIFSNSDWSKNQSIGGVISNEKIHLLPVSKVKRNSIGAKEPTAKS